MISSRFIHARVTLASSPTSLRFVDISSLKRIPALIGRARVLNGAETVTVSPFPNFTENQNQHRLE